MFIESRLCGDKVQAVCGGEKKYITVYRWTRIERRIHLDLREQFFSPSGAKNSHEAFGISNVEAIAGQEEATPDRIVRLVLP